VENHGLLVIVVTGRLQYHALICSHEFLWIGSGDATWPIYDGKICLVGNTTGSSRDWYAGNQFTGTVGSRETGKPKTPSTTVATIKYESGSISKCL